MKTALASRLVVAGTALLATALLAGCGGGGGTDHGGGSPAAGGAPSSGAGFNDTDVQFATDMISHHRQALEMARAAAERSTNPRVKELAKRIEAAQDPEISTMAGWLSGWGRPVPSAEATMPGMGHGGMPGMGDGSALPGMGHDGHAPGMMTQQEMHDLMAASGAAFDRRFLELMIRHHQGAIEMATIQQRQGQDARARQLAAKVASDQAKEVAQMKEMLAALS